MGQENRDGGVNVKGWQRHQESLIGSDMATSQMESTLFKNHFPHAPRAVEWGQRKTATRDHCFIFLPYLIYHTQHEK